MIKPLKKKAPTVQKPKSILDQISEVQDEVLAHKNEHAGFLGKHLQKLEDEQKAKLRARYLKAKRQSRP